MAPSISRPTTASSPNSEFLPSSKALATTTTSISTAVSGKIPPPRHPSLLRKPNPKLVPALKQVVQTPESPPTSMLELDNDDNGNDDDEEGRVGADSSFDCVFNADADALVATTRQYDWCGRWHAVSVLEKI
ncbi:uncharacterized protein HD556DRAFT_1446189 [Suillus plorans]|uniref:Uncharacterized protein n=1 Tax=Suillus plorans TaxID=116603 RepID=A0A9P7DFG8_9AGAM|nr:uncharacterized protein HD556DRAFT_1446189 [Suillus plorans]KAG1790461.1 hypothetical protein HD556DRAFT_1446189 [Suillus plorans]